MISTIALHTVLNNFKIFTSVVESPLVPPCSVHNWSNYAINETAFK